MPPNLLSAAVRRLAGPGWQPHWRRAGRWAWRIALGLFLLGWTLGLAAWLALHWLILPRLDEWRPRIEAQATQALGHPVQIGQISVHSTGWVPSFTLRDVVLRDARGREALRLPQVSAAVSVPSLLALRLRFEQLLIDGARLEVRRDATGRWFVGGLDVDTESAGAVDGTAASDWFFEQHELLIRGGTLRWVDEQRAAPPLQLSDVQLVVRNRGRRHELRLDATPPADWGDRFAIVGQARNALLARAGDWQRWKGTLHAHLPRADVSQLRHHLDLPVAFQQGQAALRAWVDWDQGLPQALTLDTALRDVSVQLGADLAPVALASLEGRFTAERQDSGLRLAIERLAFTTTDGAAWAPSKMALLWKHAAAPAATAASSAASVGAGLPALLNTGGEFSADRLDLALLADLGERLPVGHSLRDLLRQLNPDGTVGPLQARWEGPLDAPRTWQAKAKVQGLAIAAAPSPEPGGIGRPGWRGADLDIVAGETGGQAELQLHDGVLELPGVFEEASVPLKHLSTQLQWRVDAAPAGSDGLPRIELKVLNAHFDNADARGELHATWHTGPGTGFGKGARLPGVLALNGQLVEGRAVQVARYLPLGIGASTRQWVRRAVQAGQVQQVQYRVKGDLWDFPYVNKRDGEFRISAQLKDVTLAPVPSVPAGQGEPAWESPWPAFTALHGELVFERNSMAFQQTRGRLWGQELSDVQGRIRELSDHAVLEVEGRARGPVADLLRLLRSTPLADATGRALDTTTATGVADLRLGLNIPLVRTQDTVLKASLQLPGNDVRLRPDLPLLANARGRLEATHKGVQLQAVRAQLLGGETQIDGGTQPDGSLRVVLAGMATADALRRAPELGGVARLAQRLQGQANYRLQLQQPPAATAGVPATGATTGPEWQLASNLQGLAIELPAPLHKPADALMPLKVSSTPETRGIGTPQAPRAWTRVELGGLKAAVLTEPGPNGGLRQLRSAWSWDAPLPEPVPGGRAVLALPRLDLGAWQAEAGAGGRSDDLQALPQSVQIRTPELLAGGRRLSGVTLDLQRLATPGDEGWHARLVADQAAGTVDYREPRRPGTEARIKARLVRLQLPPAEADTVADSMAGLLDRAPASVPALDIEVDDFELRGRRLGKLAVEAVNRVAGEGGQARAEWQLTRLQLSNPDAKLNATGRWQAVAGSNRRRMALDFRLDVADGGALLQRLGFGRVVRGAKGAIQGTLDWDGSPLGLDLPSLGGRLGMAMEGGQFLKLDPGAARLLGVLSLQALPRRLLLDFRDVFQEGFAFDSATGDLRIARGVAHTDNLRLRGVQALVLMEGSADIGQETQNLHVVVVPELNAGSASLAYAAVNPAVGLGAFLGQWLLREPLRQASAREFAVTGTWDDPKVERIERKLLAPLPAAAADVPASAPTLPLPGADAASAPNPRTKP